MTDMLKGADQADIENVGAWAKVIGDLLWHVPPEKRQEVLARDALHAGGLLEIVAELAFEDEVDALDLLLLAELLAVADQRLAAAQGVAVLSGRLRAALLNRARRLETAVALQKQFRTFAAAQTAHRTTIPSHFFCLQSKLQTEKFTDHAPQLPRRAALRPLGHKCREP